LEVVSARAWRNEVLRFDVDGDQSLSPLDVLALIDAINGRVFSAGSLPARTSTSPSGFYDPDGDGTLSPLDVLAVVNELNRGKGGGEGEGPVEVSVAAPVDVVRIDQIMAAGLEDLFDTECRATQEARRRKSTRV
jgi:hypothetical protein